MSGTGLVCNIVNGVIKFERDASEAEKASCLAMMKSNPVLTKSKYKTDWVKFKKTFVSKFQAEFDHTDLSEVMEAKMVSSDLNPKVFGGILRTYIQQFFEEGIHESVSPGLKGFEYYYALDEINSKMDIWEQINLVSKLGAMRSIANPNQSEAEEYGKLLELIDYYVPLSHFHVIQFISFIPKGEREKFLRELKLLDPENIANAANFRSQQLIRLYNNFKLKFSEEEEVNYAQKKKNNKRFCKTCKKRHVGKCPTQQEESVNFVDPMLGYNSKRICSEQDNYLVLVEQENEEINVVEQNEEFLLDTGATVHVVNNLNWLTNVKKCSMNIRTINAKKSYDTVGDVKLSDDLILKDAVYIKDSPRNIISLPLLNKEGYDSVQEECVCKIKLGNKIICQVPLKEKLYVLNTSTLFEQQQVFFVLGNDSKSTRTFKDYGEMEDKVLNEILGPNDDNEHVLTNKQEPKWYCAHLKFGHASRNQLSTLGIKVSDKIPDYCLDCAGIVHKTIGKKSLDECTEGEMLSVDLIGPIYNQYALVCIDNKTKFLSCYIMNNKSQASDSTITIINILNNILKLQNKSVVRLRADNEFRTIKLQNYCEENGILTEFTAPNSSFQNGAVENANKQIKLKLRLFMKQSGISKSLWTYAFKHAVYVLNHIPRNLETESPWKKLSGKTKDVSDMCPFGCLMLYYNYNNDQKVFTNYKSGVFLGYDNTNKIAFILDVENKKIVRSSAFKAVENMFPLQKKNWYNNTTNNDKSTFPTTLTDSSNSSSLLGIGDGTMSSINMSSDLINQSSKLDKTDLTDKTNAVTKDSNSLKNGSAILESTDGKDLSENETVDKSNTASSIQNDNNSKILDASSTSEKADSSQNVDNNELSSIKTQTRSQKLSEQALESRRIPSEDNIPLILFDKLDKYHDRSLTIQESNQKLMHNQQKQTDHVLELYEKMFERFSPRPSDIPPENGLLNLAQPSQNQTEMKSLDNKQIQPSHLLEGIEPPALIEYNPPSPDIEPEHNELTVPETPNFEVDYPSTSTPLEDYKRAMELAHKYALNPSLKRFTHANDDDEYITLVSKQKKRVQEGPSLHARAINPDGSVHEISKTTSKVTTNVYDASRNQTSIENRTSIYPQKLEPDANPEKRLGLNGNFQDALDETKENDVYLLVNKAKYPIPENMAEAMKTPQSKEWLNALNEEIKSIQVNKVYRKIKRSNVPPEALIVKSRLVFSVKQEKDLQTMKDYDRFKVRLVAKGFTQEIGVNYLDIYSPVMKYDSLRLVLTIAGIKKWNIKQLDAKNAFLNGELDVPVYLQPPPGVIESNKYIWKLNKSLYGLKQSPRIWYQTLTNVLVQKGFEACVLEPCLLWKPNCMILIYVDDILITGKTTKDIEDAAKILKDKFVMKDMGEPKLFLGMNLNKLADGRYSLSLKDTITRMVKDANIKLTNRTISTPISEGFDRDTSGFQLLPPEQHQQYRSYVGMFGFLANTVRFDLAFTVSYLSRYQESPTEYQLKAAIRALNYLHQTKDFTLYFGVNKQRVEFKDFRLVDKTGDPIVYDYPKESYFKLTTVTDADWAGDHRDRKSQCGAIILLNGNPVTWFSRKESDVAISSAESEYIGMFEATKESMAIYNLLHEIGLTIPYVNLVGDNQSALTLGAHNTNSRKTKHIDLRYHFVREMFQKKTIKLAYVQSLKNPADILTKFPSIKNFEMSKEIITK